MKYSFDGFNYLIKLSKGERLSEALEQFFTETKIEGAWVNGLGAAVRATLGFYDLDRKEYYWEDFEGLREVASITGNFAYDEHGTMMYHLHGVLSDREFRTVAGHIKDLVVGATLELFVHRAYQPTRRILDPDVGLPTLDL